MAHPCAPSFLSSLSLHCFRQITFPSLIPPRCQSLSPEIAPILSVTVHTVNRHLERIFTKLDVDNRQKAIVTLLERFSGV